MQVRYTRFILLRPFFLIFLLNKDYKFLPLLMVLVHWIVPFLQLFLAFNMDLLDMKLSNRLMRPWPLWNIWTSVLTDEQLTPNVCEMDDSDYFRTVIRQNISTLSVCVKLAETYLLLSCSQILLSYLICSDCSEEFSDTFDGTSSSLISITVPCEPYCFLYFCLFIFLGSALFFLFEDPCF